MISNCSLKVGNWKTFRKSYFINQEMIYDMMYEFEDEDFTPIRGLIIVFKIAEQLYTIDQLIAAYKRKWSEIMQDKMEQQTKIKATCKKDIVAEIKRILGKE